MMQQGDVRADCTPSLLYSAAVVRGRHGVSAKDLLGCGYLQQAEEDVPVSATLNALLGCGHVQQLDFVPTPCLAHVAVATCQLVKHHKDAIERLLEVRHRKIMLPQQSCSLTLASPAAGHHEACEKDEYEQNLKAAEELVAVLSRAEVKPYLYEVFYASFWSNSPAKPRTYQCILRSFGKALATFQTMLSAMGYSTSPFQGTAHLLMCFAEMLSARCVQRKDAFIPIYDLTGASDGEAELLLILFAFRHIMGTGEDPTPPRGRPSHVAK